MVTKEGTAQFMPDEWKEEIAVLALAAHGKSTASLEAAMTEMVDRYVTEAVMLAMAMCLDETEPSDKKARGAIKAIVAAMVDEKADYTFKG